ncbi:hypothetical protein SLEP1_g59313 [Rubroshorea leprosula]|uniref:Uncharacterized protein n=1 Tax=Rubroshorea leprosula TaxID=152421 RepID=A0AAV5MT74_9ROSI|nr:hypothetical protein SLEP1_g59313 [Rubroshorea leprosula]
MLGLVYIVSVAQGKTLYTEVLLKERWCCWSCGVNAAQVAANGKKAAQVAANGKKAAQVAAK